MHMPVYAYVQVAWHKERLGKNTLQSKALCPLEAATPVLVSSPGAVGLQRAHQGFDQTQQPTQLRGIIQEVLHPWPQQLPQGLHERPQACWGSTSERKPVYIRARLLQDAWQSVDPISMYIHLSTHLSIYLFIYLDEYTYHE